MKKSTLDSLTTEGFSFDVETWLIQKGNLSPPLVCGSVANAASEHLLDPTKSLEVFLSVLKDKVLIGANIPFDNLVMAVHAAKQGIDIMPQIFAIYKKWRVFDVLIAEQLNALANGYLGKDHRTGGPLRSPSTGQMAGYSLEVVSDLALNRKGAKANDKWRLSYALLSDTPLSEWPEDAKIYPLDDARNTWDVGIHQASQYKNMHDMGPQAYADWCLHLGAAQGFNVSPPKIEALRVRTIAAKEKGQGQFLASGILKQTKKDGVKKHTRNFKTKLAKAYGCHGVCRQCRGLGLVAGATKCLKSCPGDSCTRCFGLGFKPKSCKRKYFTYTDEDGGFTDANGVPTLEPVEGYIDGCDGTGFDLDSVPLPRTEKGGIAGGRDSLYESGDDELIEFAAWGENDKILSTYIPWLEKGIDEDGNVIPLCPRLSVLKETGRVGGSTEYQLPKTGGVRECVVAPDGWLYGSCDWTGAELRTHAQSCITLVGYSKMADALNAGLKVHDKLASEIIGVDYDYMVANRKTDKRLGNARDAAKPPNFGFPGFMGAVTLVLQQRKQGPDTTAPNGKKYKGLRFCILAGGADACGVVKVSQWKGRPIPPTCKHCIETAEQIKEVWLATWTENVEYFEIVKKVHSTGRMTQHYSNRVRGGMTLCATANGYFQAFAGDMMKAAYCRISEEMYVIKSSVLYGARLIMPLHDEAFFKARTEQASDVAKRISTIMVETMQEFCPDLAPAAEAEPALMYYWTKDAEPVWDGDTLVPWLPESERL